MKARAARYDLTGTRVGEASHPGPRRVWTRQKAGLGPCAPRTESQFCLSFASESFDSSRDRIALQDLSWMSTYHQHIQRGRDNRWGPPVADEDWKEWRDCTTTWWNYMLQSTFGSWATITRERLCGMLRVAEAQGEAYNDRSSERQIESEIMVRRALWEAHVQSPTAALEVGVR